jgi:glycosyltransferase involved in cell wall biosynthesis
MTKIALVPSSYPPALGGVEELTRHLALHLVEAGDEVEVWTGTPVDRGPETAEILDGLVVRRLPMPLPATNVPSVARTATTGRRTVAALRRAVTRFRPDVLHVQCYGPNGAYAALVSRLTGVPLVVTLQGETLMDDADIFDESRVLRAALRQGLARAAAVTACSNFTLADAVSRFGLAPDRGRVVPNGVELDATDGPATGARPAFVPGDRPYAFALGRLVWKKGFDLLVDAYAALAEDDRTFDLAIAGSGPVARELEQQIVGRGLVGRVHLLGRLERDEVAAAMGAARFFVMPSRLEPFGIVVLEAWRAGVAVVASSVGGAPEFVQDGVDGLLADPYDTEALATALRRLARDGRLRNRLARAGHARVAEFAWSSITPRYRDVYADVTGRRLAPTSVAPAHAKMTAELGGVNR